MKLDQTFYVVKDTVTGEILTETKASGFARPALYASEASASRARGVRCKLVSIPNPNYDRRRSEDLRNRWYQLTTEERMEYRQISLVNLWVAPPDGRFVIVPVTISEV